MPQMPLTKSFYEFIDQQIIVVHIATYYAKCQDKFNRRNVLWNELSPSEGKHLDFVRPPQMEDTIRILEQHKFDSSWIVF